MRHELRMQRVTVSMTSTAAQELGGHAVQFYEQDDYLCSRVGEFFSRGVASGHPGIVIATDEHRRGIAAALAVRGVDAAALTFLDARETLSQFLRGGAIEREPFHATIGGLLDRHDGHVYVYGEMVDLLWRDGNPGAATHLEELWNEVCATRDLSLLCAYPLKNFDQASDASGFDRVCDLHEMVLPAERYAESDEDARLREISRLQQRAAALEGLEDERVFLLDAAAALNRSLSLSADDRMRELAALIVPRIADGCVIEVSGDDGVVARTTAGNSDAPECITVPMKAGEHLLGTIILVRPRCNPSLAAALAYHAGIAFENARLYRLASDANRMKDEFLATLSHELRTPLTAIVGWAKMLSLGLDEAMVKTAVETIERSAMAQTALVDDMLDLSRIVTGKLKLRREIVDVAALAADAVQTVRLAAEARNIRVEIASLHESLVVMGDPTRLQQIIWNLLTNAVKFSREGTAVTLGLEGSESTVRIIVRDEGRGIAPEFLPHVFETFRQADGGSTRTHSGLGLGLAIVKYLTEHHGGTVEAHSEGKDRGATFTVTLPLAVRPNTRIPTPPDVRPADLTGVSVLLVDDDAGTRDVVSAILAHCGAEVTVASSVEKACRMLEGPAPHIVITDIAMPDRDGYSLLESLRARHAGVPTIALTASHDAHERLHDAGFDLHVRKPIDPLAFARAVADLRIRNAAVHGG
jgi:signal transduction histidine kinase